MSLQGPILIVAKAPDHALAKAFADAGAFPIVEASWAGAATALAEVKPAAVVLADAHEDAAPLGCDVASVIPFVPVVARVAADAPPPMPDALPIDIDAPAEALIARLAAALRVRTLHSTAISRAQSLREERDIVAELPDGDPLDDATVLLIGRGRHHPTLSVAVGERMGVMGALSIDQGALS